jgi:hypothetical protein
MASAKFNQKVGRAYCPVRVAPRADETTRTVHHGSRGRSPHLVRFELASIRVIRG